MCSGCLKKLEKEKTKEIKIPKPRDIVPEPNEKLHKLYIDARIAHDRYVSELMMESVLHNTKLIGRPMERRNKRG